MARPIKTGLNYFPFDVDFFNDDKVELISSEFGAKGEIILIRLLCLIYRNGYYYQWGKDESLLFAKRVGLDSALVNEVVTGSVKRCFFDKVVFDKFKILTSKGIQTRYIEAKEKAKSIEIIEEYSLTDIKVTLIPINRELTPVNRETIPKEKESKEEEIIVKERFYTHEDFFIETSDFFGITEKRTYDKFILLDEFFYALDHSNRLESYKDQFKNYAEFKILTGIKYKHSFNNFIGQQSERFKDGAWNAENWEMKLKEEKSFIEQKGSGQKENQRGATAVITSFTEVTRRKAQ